MSKNIGDMNMEELETEMHASSKAVYRARNKVLKAEDAYRDAKNEWQVTEWLIKERVKVLRAGIEAEIEELRSNK